MNTKTVEYFGLVHQSPEGSFRVTLPDFPGCISASDTLEELRANVQEAIALHTNNFTRTLRQVPLTHSECKTLIDAANGFWMVFPVSISVVVEVIECTNGNKIALASSPDNPTISVCRNCIFDNINCDLVPLIGTKCVDIPYGYWVKVE